MANGTAKNLAITALCYLASGGIAYGIYAGIGESALIMGIHPIAQAAVFGAIASVFMVEALLLIRHYNNNQRRALARNTRYRFGQTEPRRYDDLQYLGYRPRYDRAPHIEVPPPREFHTFNEFDYGDGYHEDISSGNTDALIEDLKSKTLAEYKALSLRLNLEFEHKQLYQLLGINSNFESLSIDIADSPNGIYKLFYNLIFNQKLNHLTIKTVEALETTDAYALAAMLVERSTPLILDLTECVIAEPAVQAAIIAATMLNPNIFIRLNKDSTNSFHSGIPMNPELIALAEIAAFTADIKVVNAAFAELVAHKQQRVEHRQQKLQAYMPGLEYDPCLVALYEPDKHHGYLRQIESATGIADLSENNMALKMTAWMGVFSRAFTGVAAEAAANNILTIIKQNQRATTRAQTKVKSLFDLAQDRIGIVYQPEDAISCLPPSLLQQLPVYTKRQQTIFHAKQVKKALKNTTPERVANRLPERPDQQVEILEFQVEGKRRVKRKAFINWYDPNLEQQPPKHIQAGAEDPTNLGKNRPSQ